MLTDDSGVFDFTELPAGRYTLTVSKSGFVVALVRPAAAAAGRHAAPARRRPAAEGHRLPAAARQRDRRPRVRRRRRSDAGRDGPRDALSVSAGRAAADAGRHGADRRPGPVPRVGPDAGDYYVNAHRAAISASAAGGGPAAAAARGGVGGRGRPVAAARRRRRWRRRRAGTDERTRRRTIPACRR